MEGISSHPSGARSTAEWRLHPAQPPVLDPGRDAKRLAEGLPKVSIRLPKLQLNPIQQTSFFGQAMEHPFYSLANSQPYYKRLFSTIQRPVFLHPGV